MLRLNHKVIPLELNKITNKGGTKMAKREKRPEYCQKCCSQIPERKHPLKDPISGQQLC